jgi:hypothetical protein
MERRDQVENLLKQVKRVLLPNLPDNGSKGYDGNVYSSPALPSGNLGSIKISKCNED